MISAKRALGHLRNLIEGRVGGAVYPVPANRFKPTNDRMPLDEQPEDGIQRRYELLPLSWADGYEDTGPANVSGQLIDLTLIAALRVGYSFGGGAAGMVHVTDEMLHDAFLLRRLLGNGRNHDEDNTTIKDLHLTEVTFDFAEAPDRRAIMTMTVELKLEDDWSSES